MFKSGGHGQFDKLLEKATSQLLLEPDWSSIIAICDLIRQKDCQPKYALVGIKKKLANSNPHVIMFGLQVLESIVKNCGSQVHDEVATKPFMEDLRELTKTTQHENVREKLLELLQTWASAFRKMPTYRAVNDVVNIMKAEGQKFPPIAETEIMFVSDTAPEWAEGDVCHRCRTEFGVLNRKHHCRACGQIFCQKCSSKLCTLPKFGIEKEVRVCDACYEKYGKDDNSRLLDDMEDFLPRSGPPPQTQIKSSATPGNPPAGSKTKTEEEEEEELQLALAISQSEAEAKALEEKKKAPMNNAYNNSFIKEQQDNKINSQSSMETEDPELARYLNRNYWDSKAANENSEENSKDDSLTTSSKRKSSETNLTSTSSKEKLKNSTNQISNLGNFGFGNPTATVATANVSISSYQPSAPNKENNVTEQADSDDFVENLRCQIEMFLNRMKANSSRGRPISYDTSVQGLFMNITALHPQLLGYIQAQVDSRAYYERLQDKLSEVSTARIALDALRKEHSERLSREAEAAEQRRKQQIYEKLALMREQKQQYLQYQRHLLMQRMQEQERLMQMRIDQQNQQMPGIPFSPQQQQYGQQMPPPNMPSMPTGYMPNQVPISNSPGMQQPYQGMPQQQLQYMPSIGGPPPQQSQPHIPNYTQAPPHQAQHHHPQQQQHYNPQQQQQIHHQQSIPAGQGQNSNQDMHQQQQHQQNPNQSIPTNPQQHQYYAPVQQTPPTSQQNIQHQDSTQSVQQHQQQQQQVPIQSPHSSQPQINQQHGSQSQMLQQQQQLPQQGSPHPSQHQQIPQQGSPHPSQHQQQQQQPQQHGNVGEMGNANSNHNLHQQIQEPSIAELISFD